MSVPDGNLILEFEIPSGDFSVAGKASSKIKKTLGQLGVSSQIVRRAAVATYEAEMNIVIHSQGGKISLIISTQKALIICEDKGPGISDIELAMQEGYSTASDKIRELGFGAGMGLPNMKRCSDDFSIDSEIGKGTTVKMTIILK